MSCWNVGALSANYRAPRSGYLSRQAPVRSAMRHSRRRVINIGPGFPPATRPSRGSASRWVRPFHQVDQVRPPLLRFAHRATIAPSSTPNPIQCLRIQRCQVRVQAAASSKQNRADLLTASCRAGWNRVPELTERRRVANHDAEAAQCVPRRSQATPATRAHLHPGSAVGQRRGDSVQQADISRSTTTAYRPSLPPKCS